MFASATRELDGLLPHSCRSCENIEIDGTASRVHQSFTHTLPEVQALAINCLLYRWVLLLLPGRLEPPVSLDLSVPTDLEDLEVLFVNWSDARGSLDSAISVEKSKLHIFAEKGTF
jgi:hypothetical protein